jgi:hypothetical protein
MRIGLAGIGLALGLGITAPAYAQQPWTLAAQTGTSSFLVPVDPERARGPADLKQLKVLMVKRSSPKSIPQVASENGWEFNCVARTWRWVSSRALNSRGEVFDDNWKPTEWTPLKQDAMGYMSGFACGETKPIGPAFSSAKAAIDSLWKEEAPRN